VMTYEDRPGIVAIFGTEFGDAGINIAGMQIARQRAGGEALSVLTVDSPVPDAVLERIAQQIQATTLRAIEVVEV
jgi:D-3-phosphoglycerate dehydrogenase / 2-oxoglutarate reductase